MRMPWTKPPKPRWNFMPRPDITARELAYIMALFFTTASARGPMWDIVISLDGGAIAKMTPEIRRHFTMDDA